jgi:hypothetical protein
MGRKTKPNASVERPAHVVEALSRGDNLYYFGLGSNMLRSKLENRGVDGGKIELISMRPAVVPKHRLAFNMRGFLPLEPGMGSLEPLEEPSLPLLAYEAPECHGALVLLTPENYEKVMRSEGVSANSTNPGYEEIVVDAYPYGSSFPVKAVALRARSHVRLNRDPAPSQRYMNILREGAAELGIVASYQDFLDQHPVQKVPFWLRRIAVDNFVFTFMISSKLKTRVLSRIQSWILFRMYSPKRQEGPRKVLHDAVSAAVLLPGALVGSMLRFYFERRKAAMPPFLVRMLKLLDDEQSATVREIKQGDNAVLPPSSHH